MPKSMRKPGPTTSPRVRERSNSDRLVNLAVLHGVQQVPLPDPKLPKGLLNIPDQRVREVKSNVPAPLRFVELDVVRFQFGEGVRVEELPRLLSRVVVALFIVVRVRDAYIRGRERRNDSKTRK